MKRYATLLLILATAPAMADRYENSSYTRPLQEFCQRQGRMVGLYASYRDDGFKEQAVRLVNDKLEAQNPPDVRFFADLRDNITMVYHMGGWMMSTPEQIAQGAYENCMAQHGSETWWRQPAVAGAP